MHQRLQGTEQTFCKPASRPVLMLSTTDNVQTGRSGYSILADYVPRAGLIEVARGGTPGLVDRVTSRVLRRFMFSGWYRTGSARMEWQGWREIRRGDHGALHVLWADRDLGVLDRLKRFHNVPLCGTFHSCVDTLPENVQFPTRLKNLDAILLMSETQRPFFERHGVSLERIHVVLHGIDTSHFRPRVASERRGFTVLSVGSYRRNFDLLRQVCIGLRHMEGVKVRIVAPDRMRAQFVDLKHVEFASGLTDEQLLTTYQTASCLLLTADGATANNALLEGMACGLPVVAEHIGGIPEYVNEDCAILTPPGEAARLIDGIRALVLSQSLHGNMGRASRQHAESLDWTHVARRTMDVYRTMGL